MKKYDSIQIWNLTDYPSDLNVIISKKGRDWLRKKLLEKYGFLKIAVKKLKFGYWGLIDNLRGRRAMDFSNFIQLIKKLNLNKKIIQKEIEGLVIRSIKIKNVHLPIRCDPVFASLFINLLGDGGLHKRSGTGCFHYGESESYQLIQEKILHILGETPYQKGEFVPRVLVFLMMKYFNAKNIATKQNIFPKKLFNADKFTKLACLIAFINDEGTTTTSNIPICSSNYKLLNGVRDLSQSLGYKVSKISCRKDKDVYLFRINSIRVFNRDYKELVKRYPQVRLINRKERPLRILDLISQRPKGIRHTKEIFKLIAPNLKSGPKTIYDLCEITQSTQSTLWRHLRKLMNANLIKREFSNSKTRYIYILS